MIAQRVGTIEAEEVESIHDAKVARALKSKEEHCTCCWEPMGFSKSLTIEHPKRTENGRLYVEGSGQVCDKCNLQKNL